MATKDDKTDVADKPDRRHLIRITRDAIIFYTGWLGVLHQTFIADQAQDRLLILFASMMGIPATLRLDEKLRRKS